MNELVKNLGLDWKLLLAQIVNFAILLFLLKKFLYKPILEILEKRRQKIEKGLKDAERIGGEMVRIRETRDDILKKANRRADEIIKEARDIAQTKRVEILEETKKETKTMLDEAKKSIEKEKEKLVDEARKDLAELVVMATEKMVREKLDEEKERRLAEEVLAGLSREE